MINFGKFKILKTDVLACDYPWLIKKIFHLSKKKIIVAPVASHPLVLAAKDKSYQHILNKIDFVLPDSFYVKWALNFLYKIKLKERLYGPKLMKRLLSEAQKKGLTVFFIGNHQKLFLEKIKKTYPNLNIAFFLDITGQKIKKNLVKKINFLLKKYCFDLVFIGIGSPSQHILAVQLEVKKPIICVGAAFDFISGVKKQAPEWLGEIGGEWLYRLINEPRLWRRYLFSGVFFLVKIFEKKLNGKILP